MEVRGEIRPQTNFGSFVESYIQTNPDPIHCCLHGLMEAAAVWWTCSCGIKVKAVLDMSRTSVTVQCPNTSCTAQRTVPGQITRLSVETEQHVWRAVDLDWLIYPH
jgi:hypothetical protein